MNRLKKFYIFLIILLMSIAGVTLASEIFAFSHLSIVQSAMSEVGYRNEKITEKLAILENLKTRFEKVEPDLEKVNVALPDKKEASQLLSDLDSLATSSGLRLTLLQATEIEKKTKKTGDQSLLQTVKGKYGQELPIIIRVEGPFQNFVNFTKRLENYQRLVSIEGVEINKSEDKSLSADSIEVKLNLRAYLKK